MAELKETREVLLIKALELIKEYSITAYEIEQKTDLTAVGVQKMINGETKKPQKRTLETIVNYITNTYVSPTKNTCYKDSYLVKDGVKISVREMAIFFVDNQEAFMHGNILKNFIDLMVEKKLRERINELKEEID
jgi:hypothetical protein